MNLAVDLDEFLILHRPHGGMTPTAGQSHRHRTQPSRTTKLFTTELQ